jgi:hypothetical protein
MGFRVKLHGSNFEPLMPALGHKRTLRCISLMSALPPKADMLAVSRNFIDRPPFFQPSRHVPRSYRRASRFRHENPFPYYMSHKAT